MLLFFCMLRVEFMHFTINALQTANFVIDTCISSFCAKLRLDFSCESPAGKVFNDK